MPNAQLRTSHFGLSFFGTRGFVHTEFTEDTEVFNFLLSNFLLSDIFFLPISTQFKV